MLALGVDVSVSRGLDLVLLDEHRQFFGRPLRAQTADDLAHILSTHRPEIVAIDSPPSFGISGASRVAERELLKLGIHSYFTPSGPEKARKKFCDWMRVGFRVSRRQITRPTRSSPARGRFGGTRSRSSRTPVPSR
jgi:hypothetical protein